jgi:hypothetical protein
MPALIASRDSRTVFAARYSWEWKAPPAPAPLHELCQSDDTRKLITPDMVPSDSAYKSAYLPGKPDVAVRSEVDPGNRTKR